MNILFPSRTATQGSQRPEARGTISRLNQIVSSARLAFLAPALGLGLGACGLDLPDQSILTAPAVQECGDTESAENGTIICPDNDHDGYAVNEGNGREDCDDSNSDTHPGADELCDGQDNDCDGETDEGLDFVAYAIDLDGDAYGNSNGNTVEACAAFVDADGNSYQVATDCNDGDVSINPGMVEVCNELDDNCNGEIDEGVTMTYYFDADGDLYGSESVKPVQACEPLGAYTASEAGDCDDGNAAINPAASEIPDNGVDDDCDGEVDGAPDPTPTETFVPTPSSSPSPDETFIPTPSETPPSPTLTPVPTPSPTLATTDVDGDGFFEPVDCNDSNADIYPGADELCDGEDNDCDDSVDEEPKQGEGQNLYTDGDGDGYGAGSSSYACPADGLVASGGDCNDSNSAVNPGETEIPYNNLDEDCVGGDLKDVDGDGYNALVVGGDDCDDNNSQTYPSASEVGDGKDNDCDGVVDEGLNITDDDGDNYSEAQGDCDDSNAAINPAANELCTAGVDENCDGSTQAGAVDTVTKHRDADGDNYGAIASSKVCPGTNGYISDGTDCDDNNPNIHPGAIETPYDGIDQDCSGADLTDRDGDGYDGGVDGDDCKDQDASINPGAAEICDGKDNDCSGVIDDNAVDANTYYFDSDGDGFGNSSITQQACVAPDGYVAVGGDCKDTNAIIYPGAAEICDGVDQDCDTVVDEGVKVDLHPDRDGDGYGAFDTEAVCAGTSGYVENGFDCDDGDAYAEDGSVECPWIELEMMNCAEILATQAVFIGVDGVYYVDPDREGIIGPTKIYCDMTMDGGGWTLVGKIYAGGYDNLTNQQYIDLVLNVSDNVNPEELLYPDYPQAGLMAFYNKDITDALGSYNDGLTIRAEVRDNPQDIEKNNGIFFQQTINSIPLWDGMRNSFLWGNGEWYQDFYVGGYGETVVLCKAGGATECYNPDTGFVEHDSQGDLTFGCWELTSFNVDGYPFDTCRHGGIVVGGYDAGRYQYSWTLNPSFENLWKSDSNTKGTKTVYWVR